MMKLPKLDEKQTNKQTNKKAVNSPKGTLGFLSAISLFH